MTPQEIAASLNQLSNSQLSQLDHASLYAARGYVPRRTAEQNRLADYEHRAFAREVTRENPLTGLAVGAMTPVYQLYKLADGKSRSDPSLNQIGQGMAGVGEGLWQAFRDRMPATASRIEETSMPTEVTDILESLRNHLQGSN